jgi:branched-subunit amino acid transport protein
VSAFAILAAGGAITWLLRVAFIDLLPPRRLPPVISRALEGVGPAAMAALIATELSHRIRETDPVGAGVSLAAVIVAGAVAWRTKKPTLTVGVAIASYWLIQTLLLANN